MKTAIVLSGLFFCSLAYGQTTITLPDPTTFQVVGHACGGDPPAATISQGFSSDGSHVVGMALATTTCSAGGRGGNSATYKGCAAVVWDLAGNLVSTTVIAVNYGKFGVTYPAACSADPTQTYTDPTGLYTTWTVTGRSPSDQAMLQTP